MLQVKSNIGGDSGGFYPSVFITGLYETDTVSMAGEGKTYIPKWTTVNGVSGWYFPKITKLGTYTIIATDGTNTATEEILIDAAIEFEIAVMLHFDIVSWADGTDEQIAAMVNAADAGAINLADYWSVGDERSVTLSAMSATGVGESHAKQTVTMVLMHAGLYELVDGGTCNFIVGQKNGLAEKGNMSSSGNSWDGHARRTWCNNVYYDAIPDTLRPIFKKFKTITAQIYNGSTNKISEDYFALPAEKEIYGSITNSNTTEAAALTQFDYYKTSANIIKKLGNSGSATGWWERSPSRHYSDVFCIVASNGSAGHDGTSTKALIAPFGCI